MPLYKVSLRQGSRTHTIDKPIEAKSLQNLLDFLEATTTGQPIRIMEIVYDVEFDERADNPQNYYNETKIIMGNKENIMQMQFRLPWLKKEAVKDLPQLCKKHLLIDDLDINTVNHPIY